MSPGSLWDLYILKRRQLLEALSSIGNTRKQRECKEFYPQNEG